MTVTGIAKRWGVGVGVRTSMVWSRAGLNVCLTSVWGQVASTEYTAGDRHPDTCAAVLGHVSAPFVLIWHSVCQDPYFTPARIQTLQTILLYFFHLAYFCLDLNFRHLTAQFHVNYVYWSQFTISIWFTQKSLCNKDLNVFEKCSFNFEIIWISEPTFKRKTALPLYIPAG